ncbi:MAG: hypothetical protein JST46_17745 [Bacteroidetes bacterium]|nr:hypothetical protein [Bacteroidota bacterium]
MKTSPEQEEFLLRHPDHAVQAISLWYPLPFDLIRKHRKALEWDCVYSNPRIFWNIESIDEFLHYLVEDGKFGPEFCSNRNLPWSEAFIRRYYNYLDWTELVMNEAFESDPRYEQIFYKEFTAGYEGRYGKNTRFKYYSDPIVPTVTIDPRLDLLYIRFKKDTLDWTELSLGSKYAIQYDLKFLTELESYLDYDILYINQEAWDTPFGSLNDKDIDAILEQIGELQSASIAFQR